MSKYIEICKGSSIEPETVFMPYIPITTGVICNGVHKEYRTKKELHRANPQVPLDVIKEIAKNNKSL